MTCKRLDEYEQYNKTWPIGGRKKKCKKEIKI